MQARIAEKTFWTGWGLEQPYLLQNFIADYAGATSEVALSGPDKERLLNQVICQHFFRQGMLDIGEELARVSIHNPS